ncbi:MAG: histidine kinase [Pseudolabrys sp.]
MPSLFRFLLVVGLLGGLGYVTVFALANFVKPQPREISVTITPDKFLKPPR